MNRDVREEEAVFAWHAGSHEGLKIPTITQEKVLTPFSDPFFARKGTDPFFGRRILTPVFGKHM
jgi:hypothetical protein